MREFLLSHNLCLKFIFVFGEWITMYLKWTSELHESFDVLSLTFILFFNCFGSRTNNLLVKTYSEKNNIKTLFFLSGFWLPGLIPMKTMIVNPQRKINEFKEYKSNNKKIIFFNEGALGRSWTYLTCRLFMFWNLCAKHHNPIYKIAIFQL